MLYVYGLLYESGQISIEVLLSPICQSAQVNDLHDMVELNGEIMKTSRAYTFIGAKIIGSHWLSALISGLN